MARAEKPYSMEKNKERSDSEMLMQPTDWEMSMLYSNILQADTLPPTTRPSAAASGVRRGCLPSSRLPIRSKHEMKRSPTYHVADPLFMQRISPEPELSPPAATRSKPEAEPRPHRSKEPPLPMTIRKANPNLKTVPTLIPKVREPPPPIVVRRANPGLKTVPTLTPRVKFPSPPIEQRTSPEPETDPEPEPVQKPQRKSKSTKKPPTKRGRRRKRESKEEETSPELPQNLHYSVEPDERKPFTIRFKLNRSCSVAPPKEAEPSGTKSSKTASVKEKSLNRPKSAERSETVTPAAVRNSVTAVKSKSRSANKNEYNGDSDSVWKSPEASWSGSKATTAEILPQNAQIHKTQGRVSPAVDTQTKNQRQKIGGCPAKSKNQEQMEPPVKPQEVQSSLNRPLKQKGRRKKADRAEEVMEKAPPPPEPIRDPLPETIKGPRIKTLQEILDTLNIKLDNNRFDDRSRSQSSCDRDNPHRSSSVLTDRMGNVDCNVAKSDGSRKRSKNQSACSIAAASKNREGGETNVTDRKANCKEECLDDSSKRIKIIISGEVSRRPKKPSASSGIDNSENSAPRYSDTNENSDESDKEESESDSKEKKVQREREKIQKQERKKRQKVLAKKFEAKDKRELKEILQARSSYRRELPVDDSNDDLSDDSRPQKPMVSKSNIDMDESKRQGDEPRRIGITSPREGSPDFTKGTPSKTKERRSEQPEALSSSGDSSQQSIDESPFKKSVEDILSKLPPITDADLCLAESPRVMHSPMSTDDLQNTVERMLTRECINGITGNRSHEVPNATSFREWHETSVMPTGGGESLVLLPYVIID